MFQSPFFSSTYPFSNRPCSAHMIRSVLFLLPWVSSSILKNVPYFFWRSMMGFITACLAMPRSIPTDTGW